MKYNINLTKHKEKTLEERVVFFSLNYLRYIIVITLLVVIGVFFYRYAVDQQVVDLSDQVDEKEKIIQVSDPLIKEGEKLSKMTGIIASVLVRQNSFRGMIDYLTQTIPQGVSLAKLTARENTVAIEGDSRSINDIKLMVERIRQEKRFKEIKLMSVEKKVNSFYFQLALKGYLPRENQ